MKLITLLEVRISLLSLQKNGAVTSHLAFFVYPSNVEVVSVTEGEHGVPRDLEGSGDEAFDAGLHNAPDLNGLAFLWHDVGVRWVRGFQARAPGLLVQRFHRELPIDHGNHDVAAARLDGTIHDQEVPIVNAGVTHRRAGHAQEKGGLRVGNEDLGEVQAGDREVFCGGGEAGSHRRCRDRENDG